MPVFTKNGRSLLFVHVPKTGGTTVERALQDAGWTMRFFSDLTVTFDLPVQPFLRITQQHYHAAMLRETLRIHLFDAVFMIVRDPIARFRSEYAMWHRDPAQGAATHVDNWAAHAFAGYQADPFLFDNHLRPQVEFALDAGDIYRYEEGLDQIVADLDGRLQLGIDKALPRHFDSAGDGGLKSGDVEISDDLRDFLHGFYAADFQHLGYPTEPAQRDSAGLQPA